MSTRIVRSSTAEARWTRQVTVSAASAPRQGAWAPSGRRPFHDPAKVVVGPAIALGLGGDCLADVGLLRAVPGMFGQVASDPTVSRTIDAWP